ncbi:MAG: disulfide bond formation protein B [Rickettsiaceae bacterium]
MIQEDNKHKTCDTLILLASTLEALGLTAVIASAIILQIYFHELPCPLCILQRFGILGIITATSLNLRFGYNQRHVGLVILFAMFTGAVSLRQICLHVIPGTGSYGDPLFGLHLYTWVFIISCIILFYNALVLCFDVPKNYVTDNLVYQYFKSIAFIFVMIVLVANSLGILMECGLDFCPDNPIQYKYT